VNPSRDWKYTWERFHLSGVTTCWVQYYTRHTDMQVLVNSNYEARRMYTVAFNLSQTIVMKCVQCLNMYLSKTQVNNTSPLKQSSHHIRHNAIQICASSTSWGRISRISVEYPRVFELEISSVFESIRNATLNFQENAGNLQVSVPKGLVFCA
jgi:hypothetical protein